MLLNEFYQQLALDHFSSSGFSTHVRELAISDYAPLWWKQMMFWIADQSGLFAGYRAHVVGKITLGKIDITTPMLGGISFGLLLIVNAFLDKFREPYNAKK